MSRAYKPKDYSSVSPYVMSKDAKTFIEFATEVFAAKRLRHFDNPDGTVMHAELQIDDTTVMLADGGDDSFPSWLHVYVPDVDKTYRRALKAGGISVEEPSKSDGIDRRAAVKDPTGNTWWLATPLERGKA